MIKQIISDIKKVGLADYLWFKIYLGGDEFSSKLDMWRYAKRNFGKKNMNEWMPKLTKDRDRAHTIDMKLSE